MAKKASMNSGGAVGEAPQKSKPNTGSVGGEAKADMKGSGVMGGKHTLGDAVGELAKQHPHAYSDHGPHHGTASHVRHQPLGGLKPTGG